jgi:hypothetical protein
MSSNNPLALKPGYLNWWQSLLLAFACTLAGVIGAVMATTQQLDASGAAVGSWVNDLLKLVPHALMLFGIMADAITYNGVYWTSTIVGLTAMPVHGQLEYILNGLGVLFEKMMAGLSGPAPGDKPGAPGFLVTPVNTTARGGMRGGNPLPPFTGCGIMGGAIEKEHRTAQSLVVTASIISYFFMDLWLNRGIINALGVLTLGILLMGGQAMVISDCFKGFKPEKSLTAGVLYAMVFGVIIGGSYYAFFQSFYPMYLPSTVIPLSNTISDLSISDTGFVYVPGVGLVSASSPQGQQAIANKTALSPDEMSTALETTGTVGTGRSGQAATCG